MASIGALSFDTLSLLMCLCMYACMYVCVYINMQGSGKSYSMSGYNGCRYFILLLSLLSHFFNAESERPNTKRLTSKSDGTTVVDGGPAVRFRSNPVIRRASLASLAGDNALDLEYDLYGFVCLLFADII